MGEEEDLAAQALNLPPEDRAELLERLIATFEPRSAAQAAWLQLAKARREDVSSGRVSMVPGDEALARVRAHSVSYWVPGGTHSSSRCTSGHRRMQAWAGLSASGACRWRVRSRCTRRPGGEIAMWLSRRPSDRAATQCSRWWKTAESTNRR